ncbi:MAG: efflux transporter periplasmic adaptor subunit [Deltaproteobacteria bacterium]|nr:MAG: efflux transporter periplasmic adaptor subunit [Deltaproteobacteria bacterium]
MKTFYFLGLLFILIGITGCSGDVIDPGTESPPSVTAGDTAVTETVQARMETVTEAYEAIGTVRPLTETRIEAQVTAQIRDIAVSAGDPVEKGAVLIRLDDRQLQARADQARQALTAAQEQLRQAEQAQAAAQAGFTQAKGDYERSKNLHAAQAIPLQKLEQDKSIFLQAKARLNQAKSGISSATAGIRQAEEVIREAEIAIGFTRIQAPESGVILERLADPGDLAIPGKPLLMIQTSGFLRLEAHVPEGLIQKVTPGASLEAVIDSIDRTITATVDEILPYADPLTRTFMVKASLPHLTGLYPGMFGKLKIPVASRPMVQIPVRAVRNVGQLELVTLADGEQLQTRYIKTGRRYDGWTEVLSGLSGTETLAVLP